MTVTGLAFTHRQGEDEYEVVPGSEFVVARTALRSNASNYYVDGRKSSFGEVTDLLKAKGVDLDNNRFLILQARSFAQTWPARHLAVRQQARFRGVLVYPSHDAACQAAWRTGYAQVLQAAHVQLGRLLKEACKGVAGSTYSTRQTTALGAASPARQPAL